MTSNTLRYSKTGRLFTLFVETSVELSFTRSFTYETKPLFNFVKRSGVMFVLSTCRLQNEHLTLKAIIIHLFHLLLQILVSYHNKHTPVLKDGIVLSYEFGIFIHPIFHLPNMLQKKISAEKKRQMAMERKELAGERQGNRQKERN